MSVRRRGRVAPEAGPVASWDEDVASTSGRLPDALLNRIAAGGLAGPAVRRRAWPRLLGTSLHGTSSTAMLQLLLERLDTLMEPTAQMNALYEAKVIR
jgi:hypothetical protein